MTRDREIDREMDDLIASFLDFTGSQDPAQAKQYLESTGNNLEFAVQLYMESGGGGLGGGGGDMGSSGGGAGADEELAKKLQEEAYGAGDSVREADANVHRHETLVDNFDFPSMGPGAGMPRPGDIFGAGRAGIFNQRFDDDENAYYQDRIEELSDEEDEDFISEDENNDRDDEDEDDDELMELNSDGEPITRLAPPRSRRRLNRDNRMGELNSTQRRLANLFRPPFDLIEKVDIDTAKTLGRQQKKWIMITIHEPTEFQCQVLNRDLWSNSKVKEKVKENFIFLQYQPTSPHGESYVNFYHLDSLPHIAILDPLTGERVYKFVEGNVPTVDEWLQEVDKFLDKFSLYGTNNPMVKHDVKFDPDALTEEQQIEYAMKQSVQDNGNTEEEAIVVDDEKEPEPEEPQEDADPFNNILANDYDVGDTTDPTTRLQVRFPNGKRLVHKFKLDDKVINLYEWLKFRLSQEDYGIGETQKFILSNASNRSIKLIDSLDSTLAQANLKNASILLEKD